MSYSTGARSGVCTALVLLMMLVLHYNACMTTASGPFAVFRHPLLASRVGPLAFARLSVLVAPNSAVFE